ncbi:hypothetical protein [Streptococcus oriscaviae]|uniref:Adhesin domain-containing protein n=1 Tax=Streptococcus oriscaviae TaxID=2781599 RepID=A0ABX7YJ90_9STRE|nr:hypothetical protein [Streptococcus oriscaviae]QUE53760.1 hypothetical protein INT76_07965 [Streptococcus oriscaviae]
MKKWILVGLVGLLLLGLGAAMYNGVMNDQATELIDEKWTVESDQIQEINISGLEQPVEVIIQRSEEEKTTVRVSGTVAEETLKTVKEGFQEEEGIVTLPFSKDGLIMTVKQDKPTVTIEIVLGKAASFQEFYLQSTHGEVALTLPSDYDGGYELEAKDGGQILEQPQAGQGKEMVELHAAGNISVKKSGN